jgi:hypothetical protein
MGMAVATANGRTIIRERLPNTVRDYFGTFGADVGITSPFRSAIADSVEEKPVFKALIF